MLGTDGRDLCTLAFQLRDLIFPFRQLEYKLCLRKCSQSQKKSIIRIQLKQDMSYQNLEAIRRIDLRHSILIQIIWQRISKNKNEIVQSKRVFAHFLTIFIFFQYFIQITMSSAIKQVSKDNKNSNQFASNVSRKDQIKIVKKKMFMLKEAIFQQRKRKQQLNQQLTSIEEKLKKYEVENKRKEQKSQSLMAEIKMLKDALIQERNQKQAYIELLEGKEDTQSSKNSGNKSKLQSSKFFGLKGLFQS